MSYIYLIRHGQASFDADDYDQLSSLGEEQSRKLGEWLSRTKQTLDHVVIGGNRRHRQTAQHCLQIVGATQASILEQDWLVDQGFNEFMHEEVLLRHSPEFDHFSDLKKSIAQQSDPRRAFHALFSAAMTRWTSGEFDDYSESWIAFQERCRIALRKVIELHEGTEQNKNIGIFTSGGTISVLLQPILGINDQHIFELNASLLNTGVTRLKVNTQQIRLRDLNSTAHLELDGRPELLSYR